MQPKVSQGFLQHVSKEGGSKKSSPAVVACPRLSSIPPLLLSDSKEQSTLRNSSRENGKLAPAASAARAHRFPRLTPTVAVAAVGHKFQRQN